MKGVFGLSTPIDLELNCTGRINGDIVAVTGEGRGSVDEGRFELNLRFSHIPRGYSVSAAALWTCCSTPTFAIEEDGALNMLTLARGRYRCERTFDFGVYGAYDYNYELRLSDDETLMRATGIIEGNLELPDMDFVDDSFSEIMIPVEDNEIRSFVSARFKATDGRDIPVKVRGKYTSLRKDREWGCAARVLETQRSQIRTSFIKNLVKDEPNLSLSYLTVVKGIDLPVVSKEQLEERVPSAGAS